MARRIEFNTTCKPENCIIFVLGNFKNIKHPLIYIIYFNIRNMRNRKS